MSNIQHIIDVILDNPIYLILRLSLIILIAWSLIKKLFKLAIIFSICSLGYLVYIYMENPKEVEEKIEEFKEKVEEIIEAPLKETEKQLQNTGNAIKQKVEELKEEVEKKY